MEHDDDYFPPQRDGQHGARSAKQAIAIGLSKARRAGVKLPPPPKTASERTKKTATRDSARAGKTTKEMNEFAA